MSCASTCREFPPRRLNEITDTFLSGTHALQCSSCGTLKRHNSVLKGPIAANLTKQGYNFNTEHTILDDDGKKAGDAYVSNPYVDEPKTILDITISCPTCPTYICNAAAASNDHCTKLAEKNKHTKYDALASKLDCRVVAAAFTTYGGWGDDFQEDPRRPLLQERVQGRSQERRVRLGRHQRLAPLRAPRRGSHLP